VAIPATADRALHLDVCTRCQFLWFDPLEFEQLPKQPVGTGQRELPDRVRETMAIVDSQRAAARARGAEFGNESPEEAWKWIPALLGLPVEHEVQPVRTLPWLTWGLTAALVAVAALTFGNLHFAVEQFGLVPAEALRFGGLTFLTAFFLHAGPIHLLGNAYFLVVFGDNVEDYLGRLRYVGLLMFATILGGVLHILGDPRSEIPCVGASGGISGIIVYYSLQFPKARLGIVIRYWYIFRWIYFPAYFALICWLLLQGLTAYLQTSGLTNVSALAHLGGAAAGLTAWLVWRNR
jgi:membrane associated rhomboid family serine protease